jgi:hypothetical protein
MVPRKLNNVKMPASMFISLKIRYCGIRGIPNHPVERSPAKASVIKRYRAKL